MAFIDDIKVGGLSAGASSPSVPIVPGHNPVISWLYANDPGDPGQVRFEMRISTTSTLLGSDSFVGSIAEIDIKSGSNFYDYSENNLLRGLVYYGQIRGRDADNDITNWSTFSFRLNQLPYVTGQFISPASPTAAQDLDLFYDYYDPDDHDQAGTKIRWMRNGIHMPQYDDLCILPASALSAGDSWLAKIIPSDGLEFGFPADTESVTVQAISAIDPVTGYSLIRNVRVLPENPNVDDILKVEYDLQETPYLPLEEYVILEWYLNDELVADSNAEFIRLSLSPGDEVYARVRISSAGGADIVAATSEPVAISDVPWYVYGLEVSGQRESINLPDVTPVLTWQLHKTTALRGSKPLFLRVIVNKVNSLDQTIYDSGYVEYKTASYQIPSGVLSRGHSYFVHVGAGDESPFPGECYASARIRLAGSAWETSVNNAIGWSIEFKMSMPNIAGDSPFVNPFLPAGQASCPESEPEDSACNRFETNKTAFFDNIKIVASHNDVLGPENSSWTDVGTIQSMNVLNSGFVIKRIYPYRTGEQGGCQYDGDFLEDAVQPFDTSATASDEDKAAAAAWQACYSAYHEMDIPARRESLSEGNEIRLHVHDGARFCSISFQSRKIIFTSVDTVTYSVPTIMPDLSSEHVYRIDAQGTDATVYLDNTVVLTLLGGFNAASSMRRLEFGDFNTRKANTAILDYFRYTTSGTRGTDNVLTGADTFYFKKVSSLKNGSINFLTPSRVVWTPDDADESSKIYEWNPDATPTRLAAVNRNFSPITAICVDDKRNKYIGTVNGVTAIYGDKHNPDYELDISNGIRPVDFDRITNVPAESLPFVEQSRIDGWISIDTTYRSVGHTTTALDPYDPYNPYYQQMNSSAIHYYSQRSPGHAWFDNVDNQKGWRVSFSFLLSALEADDFVEEGMHHDGFGMYLNDGTRQEIVYFYEDRIRLFYANVYKPISTTTRRDYIITAKGNNIYIYQRPNAGSGVYSLLLDGSGLFTTPATPTANNTKPKVVFGTDGSYHAVWQSDSNKRSRVYYSKYDGATWSYPEVVTESDKFDLRNPELDVDSRGRVWVVYEDTSWGPTELSVSVRDQVGWNPKTRITNSPNDKGKPSIKVDIKDNVHVVWEDQRNGNWQILYGWWESSRQAWHSSGQFGSDEIIMQHNPDDPYLSADVMEFRKPKLTLLNPLLWVVCEVKTDYQSDYHKSVIYTGYRNLSTNKWVGSGVSDIDEDGTVVGTHSGFVVSNTDRFCVDPAIAANPTTRTMLICWRDDTDPTPQIYGQVMDSTGGNLTEIALLSDGITASTNPCVGAVDRTFVIAYTTPSSISVAQYSNDGGAAGDGGSEASGFVASTSVLSTSVDVESVCIPPVEPSADFFLLYDYQMPRTASELSSVEYPDFWLIGAIQRTSGSGETSTLDEMTVTPLDTKEFAFGDISENVGMLAHWRDLQMYFGYDSRPYSITNLNTNNAWPDADNKINDVFSDVYGNLVVSTYSGLVYYNVFAAKPVYITHFKDKVVNMAKWAKSGRWYVAFEDGIAKSTDAGKTWSNVIVNKPGSYIWLAVNDNGYVVAVKSDAVVILKADDDSFKTELNFADTDNKYVVTTLRCAAIDEDNILWLGAEDGLYRVENFSLDRITRYSSINGMRSSYVNDIAIVNRQLRYIATVTGIEKMVGSRFQSMNVHNYDLASDNVYRLKWYPQTSSLWAGSIYKLHEIVFRDASHEIIADEVVAYNSMELGTSMVVERDRYYVVDASRVPTDEGLNYRDSSKVFINRNEIDFGYTVSENGLEVAMACDLLLTDQVDVELSTMFALAHDFNQLTVEEELDGKKTTLVSLLKTTSTNRDFCLASTNGQSSILLDAGWVQVPFATIMLDLEKPFACLKKTETISRSLIRFSVVAYDGYSGLDSYQISNNLSWTEDDGVTPLEWLPITSSVTHEIGENIDNAEASYEFPDELVIGSTTHVIGDGSFVGTCQDSSGQVHLIAVTSRPVVVFRYYPEGDPQSDDQTKTDWRFLQSVDSGNPDRYVTSMLAASDGSLYITTATGLGGYGNLQRMSDAQSFVVVGSVNSNIARGIAETTTAILYGAGNGDIYQYSADSQSLQSLVKYSGIGQSIYAMDVYQDTLLVGTARVSGASNSALIYSLDLATGDNLIEFVRSDSSFADMLVIDKQLDPEDAIPLVAANMTVSSVTTPQIFAATMDQLSFRKSYASFNSSINRIKTVSKKVLDRNDETGEFVAIAAVGQNLLKHNGSSWEFLYKLDEEIKDFVEFAAGGQRYIWIASESKVTRWAQVTEDSVKTVYIRVKDKAGNISDTPSAQCPPADSTTDDCCPAYSLKIEDLKAFVNESRIIDVTEDGQITFAYDSPTGNPLYSADRIDFEQGTYLSEIFNGSSNLVAWKSISWQATEPPGTDVKVQIRYGSSEDAIRLAEWSTNLDDTYGTVNIEYVTAQYLQFRVILTSTARDVSPTLTSVTIRNITTQASHFFTTNFVLPSRPVKGLLTANTYIPISSDIIFGINTKNTTDFADYQVIEANRLFTVPEGQYLPNLRIGARLLSPSLKTLQAIEDPYDPYLGTSYICAIDFNFTNTDATSHDYHFRVKFFNDPLRTQLVHTFFSGNDQTGWMIEGGANNTFPATGLTIGAGSSQRIIFTPATLVEENQRWYISIDSFDGLDFAVVDETANYACSTCYVVNEPKLVAEYYQTGLPELSAIPVFGRYTPDHVLLEDQISFPTRNGQSWVTTDGQLVEGYQEDFAIRFRGRIQITVPGTYTFYLSSDDGSRLYIDGTEVIDNDGVHTTRELSAATYMSTGYHNIEVHYFQKSGNYGVTLSWVVPGEINPAVIPASRFFHAVTSEYCVNREVPRIMNFAVMFELENGETVKLNLS
jgi:hypothetical protein